MSYLFAHYIYNRNSPSQGLSVVPVHRPLKVGALIACVFLGVTGLQLLGVQCFIFTIYAVVGIRQLLSHRGIKNRRHLVLLLCSVLLILVPQLSSEPPMLNLLERICGMFCVAISTMLSGSGLLAVVDYSSLLYSATALALGGVGLTVVLGKRSVHNEMTLLFCYAAATSLGSWVSFKGLSRQLTPLTSVTVIAGTALFSAFLQPFWYIPVLSLHGVCSIAAATLLTLAHQKTGIADSLPNSVLTKLNNPAQLFKSSQKNNSTDSVIITVLSNQRERKLAIFFFLTMGIMLLEFLYGVAVNSLGLISDSFHMMLDGTSIAIGLYAAHAASWRPDEKTHPLGYARYEVFGGFVNGVLLLFIALYVTVESVQRIIEPPEIEGPYLLLVSIIGLAINVVGVIFFHDSHGHSHSHSHGECSGSHVDHNMRGVYLHILADLLGSVSVITSSLLIYFFGWWIADPICSALSAILILLSSFPLLEETGKVLLLAAPDHEKDFCNDIRETILRTSLVQDAELPKIWIHSTPPRELTICTVAAKLRANVDYTSARSRIIDCVSSGIAQYLGSHNVSVVVHLE